MAAWLGHYAFNQGHYEEMAQWHLACIAGGQADIELSPEELQAVGLAKGGRA